MGYKSTKLTLIHVLVIMFVIAGLTGVTIAKPNSPPLDQNATETNTNKTSGLPNPGGDTPDSTECDHVPPYFTEIEPHHLQSNVPRDVILKFRVNDDYIDENTKSGIDTNNVHITITSRNWTIEQQKAEIVDYTNQFLKVRYKYQPAQLFDWSDTVSVTIWAMDRTKYYNNTDTTYTFFVERDQFAPVLEAVSPLPDDEDISVTSSVVVHGTDEGRGINFDDVILKINDFPVNTTIDGDPNDFVITYKPELAWPYNETIKIECIATDLDGNANTLIYNFKTEPKPDTTPPSITVVRPTPDEENVSVDTDFLILIEDDESGVDAESINFFIDDALTDQTFENDTLHFQPAVPFDYLQTVDVKLEVADSAGNDTTLNYSFLTEPEPDLTPPLVEAIRPLEDAVNVPVSTDIVLAVQDSISGINWDSMIFRVNDIDVENYVITGDTIQATFPDLFKYNSLYTVYFEVQDNANNVTPFQYDFATEPLPDNEPPVLTIIRPQPDDLSVTTETDIVIHVYDSSSGINYDSGEMKINGDIVTFQWIEDSALYVPELPFVYNQTIEVTFSVADNATNPVDTTYTFITEKDTIPPIIEAIRPTEGQVGVSPFTDIAIALSDEESGLDPTSFELSIDNEVVNSTFADTVIYVPDVPFPIGAIVEVMVSVKDKAGNPAELPYSFTIATDAEPPEIVIVRPEAFQENVSLNTDIAIYVTDEISGVDEQSIELQIGDNIVDHIFENDTVRFQPKIPFIYNDSVSVNLFIADNNDITVDTSYYFKTEIDDTPPVIEPVTPEPNATDLPIYTPIIIYPSDSQSGVDFSTAELIVNGEVVPHFMLKDTIRYYSQYPFSYESRVDVTFKIADIAGNADSLDYSFFTMPIPQDDIDPIIEIIRPQQDEQNVPITTDILLRTIDYESGIDPDSVKLWIDEKLVAHTFNRDTIHYQPDVPFEYQADIHVQIEVADYRNNKAYKDYHFYTKPDTIAPVITMIEPEPDAIDVPINTMIRLNVEDVGLGVDFSSATLVVEDSVVVFDISNDTIYYQSAVAFNYTDTIDVCLTVSDSAENEAHECYQFITIPEPDTTGPQIVIIRPQREETDVPIYTPVELRVIDEQSGVDFGSAQLKIGDNIVAHSVIGDTVRYLPQTQFDFDKTVNVYFEVADSGGIFSNVDYWFKTESEVDERPPVVFDHYPRINGTVDSVETTICFKVWDDLAGVDESSIVVKLAVNNGESEVIERSTTTINDTVLVTCIEQEFNYNDSVTVDIFAKDLVDNTTDTTGADSTVHYFFTVPQDTTPPMVIHIDPKQLEDIQDTILVKISDDFSGVNVDSLRMFLWSNQDPAENEIALEYYLNIINTQHVEIEYIPTEENKYNYNDLLSLRLILQDNAGNDTTLEYIEEIATPTKLPDLHFINLGNSADGKQVKIESIVTINALISNKNINCEHGFQIKFYLNGSEQSFATEECKTGLRVGQIFEANAELPMEVEGAQRITVKIDPDPMPDGRIAEENEFNNVQETIINVEGAALKVRSNPFTPNNDGYNDFAEFNFEQFQLEQPKLKIMDIHGKMIMEFDEPQNKRFTWYGRDRHGKAVMPGIYFYILFEVGNPMTRGCVVIIK